MPGTMTTHGTGHSYIQVVGQHSTHFRTGRKLPAYRWSDILYLINYMETTRAIL